MTLQNTYYILGIVTMSLNILLLIAIVVLLFYIKRKITDITQNIQDKLSLAKEVIKHPKATASVVGGAVEDVALKKAGK